MLPHPGLTGQALPDIRSGGEALYSPFQGILPHSAAQAGRLARALLSLEVGVLCP